MPRSALRIPYALSPFTVNVADLMPYSSPGLVSSTSVLKPRFGGPAQVHAQQHLGPVLRVGAARVGLDRHDRVAAVVLAGEERVLLQPLELAAQRHDRRRDVVREALVQLEQLARVVVLARQAVVALEPPREARVLGGDGRRMLRVVPEAGLSELLLELGDARLSDPGQR